MVSIKIKKIISRKVYLFIITFLVTVSAIALAGNILTGETVPTTGQTISPSRGTKLHNFINGWTDINGYAVVTSGTLVVKGSQPASEFSAVTDSYTNYISNLIDTKDAIINARYRPALFVNGNTTIKNNLTVGNTTNKTKIRVYGQIQLGTIPVDGADDRNIGVNASSCSDGDIGTIRLTLPPSSFVSGSVCPIQICYPGGQGGVEQTSRKSACDLVSFGGVHPLPPVRTDISAIELPPALD